MKKLRIIGLIVILIMAAGTYFLVFSNKENTRNQFIFAKVTRGNIENTVSSTGTINAVRIVNVGTQVSGIIDHIYVDFNDKVKKGQIIAVIDTVLLKASVVNAEANLEKNQAQYDQARDNYKRNLPLFKKGFISKQEFLPIETNLKVQQAALRSAQTSLMEAKRNLNYAFIRSPIDGTVIERRVEAGQTIAARFSSPTLFVIAKDLSKMEILAQVDESDIGQVKKGQSVRFTVEAYPDKVFKGVVRQVRLQPTTIQNVVNYTVVVTAPNTEGVLLPGMTAMIDFIVAERHDVLLVPNSALKFRPPPEMISQLFQKKRQAKMRNFSGTKRRPEGIRPQKGNFGRLWYIDERGNLKAAPVKTGITDDINTEIIRGRGIRKGMKILTGLETSQNGNQPNNSRRRGFRRRIF